MELIRSCFYFGLFVCFGAQGFSFDDHLRIRTVQRNEGQDNCPTYERMGACMDGKVGDPPFNKTSDGTYVFAKNLFSRVCSLFTELSKCYKSFGLPDCDTPLPTYVKKSRDLANLICRNKDKWTSLLGCINKRTFQTAVTTWANSDNQQVNAENICSTANEKLNEFLQSTRTACGEEDYSTIKTLLSRNAFVFVSTFGIPRYPEQCDFQVEETPSSAL
ncbi:uncharacterized protein LOC128162993 [Crassostrea angulata]|uniref:uncharacterized protein LOC128162993 n=1 Tax=Magallana angulata TaxID=2784310 RepID=UPI0022B09883|nr:uncharacterized protein LOC128162993 [Crassostrea angulata]